MCELKSESKVCRLCNDSKSLEMFRKTKSGFRNECRKCENLQRIKRREVKLKNDPVYLQKHREYDKERKRLSRVSKKSTV